MFLWGTIGGRDLHPAHVLSQTNNKCHTRVVKTFQKFYSHNIILHVFVNFTTEQYNSYLF